MVQTSACVHHRARLLALGLVLSAAGCGGDPRSGAETFVAPSAQSGGDTTGVNRSSSAFEDPAPNLDAADLERHLEGDVAFEATFVSPPADVNPGLGPLFNHSACGSCHVKNGRGLPVTGHGPQGSQLLVRVSLADSRSALGGPAPYGEYGTQLQDHAIAGHNSEASVTLSWVELRGQYADGSGYTLRRPELHVTHEDGTLLPGEVLTSPRIPPPVFGLGLLEAVAEESLRDLEDPNDVDQDGISGRLNQVWSAESKQVRVGRFGWKANTANLREQAAGAYSEDMGVSNPLHPEADGSMDVDATTLAAAAFYTQTLAVPRRAPLSEQSRRGAELFSAVECGKCHVPELSTLEHEIAALRFQTIAPYTDLLLHDMGPELADGRPDFEASGSEWRTPPLWGIGVTETVLGSAAYLHDGRARTLEEAILWHGGEAENSREAFRAFPEADRDKLIEFLLTL